MIYDSNNVLLKVMKHFFDIICKIDYHLKLNSYEQIIIL